MGVNSGLGKEALRVLILRNATVIGLTRSLEKANKAYALFGDQAIPLAKKKLTLTNDPPKIRKGSRL